MCLFNLYTAKKNPTVAYKQFDVTTVGGKNYLCGPVMSRPIRSKVNNFRDRSKGFIESMGSAYKTGYHAYLTREGARFATIGGPLVLKIFPRNITTMGTQNGKKALVCREFSIDMTNRENLRQLKRFNISLY